MKFYGQIKGGELQLRSEDKWEQDLSSLPDGRVQVTVQPIHEYPVSDRMRRYYWALNRLIQEYLEDLGTQYSVRDIHEHNKDKYMSEEFLNRATFTPYAQHRSHVTLANRELLEITRKMQNEWGAVGLYLPDPNEQVERKIKWSSDDGKEEST